MDTDKHYIKTVEEYWNDVKKHYPNFEHGRVYPNPYVTAFTKTPTNLSEGYTYHLENKIPFSENIYRPGSVEFFKLMREAKTEYRENRYSPSDEFEREILESLIGEFGVFEGKNVPLDLPRIMSEAEYRGRDVDLNDPKRGGSKKFYVYTKNPESGNVIKVEFGAEGGGQSLSVKLQDPKARKAFADRHDCENKNDKTKAGYWSCRLPRYAERLGLKGSGRWW